MKITELKFGSGTENSEALRRLNTKDAELVSFKHNFRNLSNTTDFYYQQRFNSFDSEDALTVQQHLEAIEQREGYWTLEKVIDALHLRYLLDEQVIKLSNGETKRTLIASALLKNPRLLLLDHPLTGLDVKTRAAFGELLQQIAASGIEVVIASEPDEDREYAIEIDKEVVERLVPDNLPEFDTVVRMRDVHVEYDGRTILNKINWTIRQGERWSLSGPNGAGKSTLLSLITGDNPQAYANDIVLFDRKRGTGESIWDIKKHIGYVSPELYQYFPTDSSCLHVIESGFYDTIGLFRATDQHKEAVCLEWMKLMNIDRYGDVLFNRVPSNVQRLCLLARALVKNPPLLILDEPTQGLDTFQQQFFTRLIETLCEIRNVTLVYVSHYQHHIPKNVNLSFQLPQ